MLSLVDRKNPERSSSGLSIDNLDDASVLSNLHGCYDILCHCCHPPIKMVIKHRRDTNNYFLSSFPDSPLHEANCPLFRQRKTLLPDVFSPVRNINFSSNREVESMEDRIDITAIDASLEDTLSMVEQCAAADKKVKNASRLSNRTSGGSIGVVTPSMMESLLVTLTYNGFANVHFGRFMTIKSFSEKLKRTSGERDVLFPNGTSVKDGIFFGENGLKIAKTHAKSSGGALWIRLAKNVSRSEHGLVINDKKLTTTKVDWPYTPTAGFWLIMSLIDNAGAIDRTLVYPVCDSQHVIPFQRDIQREVVEAISPTLFGLNRSHDFLYYLSMPLHSVVVDGRHVIADMLIIRKCKTNGKQYRVVLGTRDMSDLGEAYHAEPFNTLDIIKNAKSIIKIMNCQITDSINLD